MLEELLLRKDELSQEIETIYFGGGTPSLLAVSEIETLLNAIYDNFKVVEFPEITLEANPEDLTSEYLQKLSKSKINRLSIGVQSFESSHLELMNRNHSEMMAWQALKDAKKYFANLSVDLIYGIPGLSNKKWKATIERVCRLNIAHISCYALTVEPQTALAHLISKGKIPEVSPDLAQEHFSILVDVLNDKGYQHYEISNFCKPDFYSKNNSAYWLGKKYLGIGPSAHSFDGQKRSWNVSNNIKYIQSISKAILPKEEEILSTIDKYNECIMTGLRTIWGIDLKKIEINFGTEFLNKLLSSAQPFVNRGQIDIENNQMKLTKNAKFLADGIASELFLINQHESNY